MTGRLYCDGGIIGPRNPSPFGGTWAWKRLDDDAEVTTASGIFQPSALGLSVASNNNAELMAMIDAIQRLPDGWTGTVHSDSQIALGWVFCGWKPSAIPPALSARLNAIQRDGVLISLRWQLLSGHPSRAELSAGWSHKRNKPHGLPVSEHNVHCDRECRRLAASFIPEQEKST